MRLTFAASEAAAPTTECLDDILAKRPEPDGVPDMRLAGCTRIRVELHEQNTVVLAFEWSGQPLPGGLDREAFAEWWGRESGQEYKVETAETPANWANPASSPIAVISYEPDINGRPCRVK